MSRSLIVAVILCLAAVPARAAEPAGTWKLELAFQDQPLTFLMMFSKEDDGWVGDLLDVRPELTVTPKFESLTVDGDRLAFALTIGTRTFRFEGKIPAEGDVIPGSFEVFGELQLQDLVRSELKNLADPFAVGKERLGRAEGGEFFSTALNLIARAGSAKANVEDVRQIADQVGKRATKYGPLWEREVALRMTRELTSQEGFAEVAVEQARRAERMLDPRADADVQLEVLTTLAEALTAAEKADETADVRKRIDRLVALDYLQYSRKYPDFKPEKYAGRQARSDRVVLVELFTGANCAPCAGADIACDALLKAFSPKEVVLLQYHMHFAGGDPLANPSTEARLGYYDEQVRGAPTVFFNGGSPLAEGAGIDGAELLYRAYREQIEGQLEKPAGVKLEATAERDGDAVKVTATVSGAKPAGQAVLRLALADERVRYAGTNGVRYHHMVLRDLPGGSDGFPVVEGTLEQKVEVDLAKVRSELAEYLTLASRQFEARGVPFPEARPIDLGKLVLVAFVQDEETREVLQAVRIDLGGE